MGRPYSQDLRERVLAVVDGGIGVTATGRLLRVSTSYVSKVMSRREMTGANGREGLITRVALVAGEVLAIGIREGRELAVVDGDHVARHRSERRR